MTQLINADRMQILAAIVANELCPRTPSHGTSARNCRACIENATEVVEVLTAVAMRRQKPGTPPTEITTPALVHAEWVVLDDGRRVIRYETGEWVLMGAAGAILNVTPQKGASSR